MFLFKQLYNVQVIEIYHSQRVMLRIKRIYQGLHGPFNLKKEGLELSKLATRQISKTFTEPEFNDFE